MHPHLLRKIERYLKRSRTSPTTFGRQALRDPRLVAQLRAGRILRPRTRARLEAFLNRAESRLGERPCRRR